MLLSILVYCVLGAVAGVLAGLLGVGGGIVIVPMLVFAFKWQGVPQDLIMLMALGTSMGSIVFTSISSSLAHSRNKNVNWGVVRSIAPGIVAVSMFTAPLGARLAQTLPVPKLKKCFAVLLIVVGVRMLVNAL